MSGLDHVPDVRDGLTVAERAVLRATPAVGEEWRKAAAVIGPALSATGLGGAELYDAIVRLAQPWRIRHPLIDPVGNFGSVDDDPPADAVYTEARRSARGEAFVTGTVELAADAEAGPELEASPEPAADPSAPLPGTFPHLLANGSWEGIAQIPPHHLGELADAIALRLDDPTCSLDDLLDVMPGPDFPTGGTIVDPSEVRDAYATGRGAIRVRAKTHVQVLDNPEALLRPAPEFEPDPANRESFEAAFIAPGEGDRLIVTELPYGVLKGGDGGVIDQVAEVVRGGLSGISGLEDYSDRRGMYFVIELHEHEDAEVVRDRLFARTDLEFAVPVLLVALVDGEPQLCTLLELLDHWIAHQRQLRATAMPELFIDESIKLDLAALAGAYGDDRRTRLPRR